MRQVMIKKGQAIIQEVPAPQIEKGYILVRVINSCISIGTEMSSIQASSKPIWEKALEQPEKVKKTLDMLITQGFSTTKELVKSKLDAAVPTGYSAAGIVIGVGEGVAGIKTGDKVACAGAQCAFHAEYINVPQNLTVKLLDNVSFEEASTVTLGAIALQGIRRAQPTLGETFCVIGLGLLGQLTVQMLKANGCKVIVSDLDEGRVSMALSLGADHAITHKSKSEAEQVAMLTGSHGADGVIITAAGKSDSIVSSAFNMCRRKGRVVLVGDIGLNLRRSDFYTKEIDFLISTSYGPGRYDEQYEEKGLEYPIGYVRWTENRNMQSYLEFLGKDKINLSPMMEKNIFSVDDVTLAYESLNSAQKPLLAILSYPWVDEVEKITKTVTSSRIVKIKDKKVINVALAGAGGFAKSMHLPNIKTLSNIYHLKAVMSRTGHNAQSTAKQFNADYATTAFEDLLNDKDIDAIVIATRHNLHAQMTLKALKAGKHVLVEKPLAINEADLNEIKDFYADNMTGPLLLTGFNRRFSIYAKAIKRVLGDRKNPLIINYRMNAGYIPFNHWVHTEEGGGRNIGEACHIYDLFNFFTESEVKDITAVSISPTDGYYSGKDNFTVSISYADGSIATLTYTAAGAKEFPKEYMELYCEGKTIVLDDYRKLAFYGIKENSIETKISDKGQKEEIDAFAGSILNASDWPNPLEQQLRAMEIAFMVEKII